MPALEAVGTGHMKRTLSRFGSPVQVVWKFEGTNRGTRRAKAASKINSGKHAAGRTAAHRSKREAQSKRSRKISEASRRRNRRVN